MEADAPVKSENEELHVVAQADTRTERHLPEHVLQLELSARAVVIAQLPHVARIEEHRAIEVAEQPGTVFQIGQQLHVAGLVEIINVGRLRVMVAARTDGTHGEGADAVGATHVELLAVGRVLRVAVSPDDTGIEVPHERAVL